MINSAICSWHLLSNERYNMGSNTVATAVCILCDCIFLTLLLFSLRKSSLLSTRNVGNFCFVTTVFMFLVRCDFITCSKCWSFGFVLAVFTCPWIVLLVFFVPHIKLVYLAFFLLFSIFKVSPCTCALVIDVFCVLVRWIHH